MDQKGDPRGLDPLSARFDSSDGDITPIEGAVTPESFPPDIPMPPTQTLPAEFECQLCYQTKKFQKPSDWTKHVHEDVQPFTCTWDRCRDPKIFKRKADWVRHENEGHRHLEWWTCDVEDCRHTCYRRDNFLQHLVREHKYPEPKVKTKAAMKRAGGIDPTWQKVEKCHKETPKRPQEEPCRFCGKTFPSWKKLTVHLAKHMEQISLPVLRLVAAKELEPDTIISPVQDPPPRAPFNQPFAVSMPVKTEHQHQQQYGYSQMGSQMQHQGNAAQPPQLLHSHMSYPGNNPSSFDYPVMTTPQFQQQIFSPHYDNIGQALQPPTMDSRSVNTGNQGFNQPQQYHTIPTTAAPYMGAQQSFMSMPQGLEPFPTLNQNPLGLQHPAAGQLGAQMGYDAMMDQSGNPDQYTPQGSVSPFSHSPHQGQGGFYSQ